MSPKSLAEHTEITAKQYKKASYEQKKVILDSYCATTGFHRKHAIRKLNTFRFYQKQKKRKSGRPKVYTHPQLLRVLKKTWLTANLPCSKILKSIMLEWLPHYEASFEPVAPEVKEQIAVISASTIDRILKPVRPRFKKKGYSCTKPGSLLRNQIPIQTEQWNETIPGFIEADTVHHCGTTTQGQYVITVNYTDLATGWTEQRAVWGKGEIGVLTQTKDVENSLPFPLIGFDSDNGSEFINHHLFKYMTGRSKRPVQFTRSRAYRKNDNAHIEQKNWTHVRQWLGYDRFDNPKTVALLNQLYTSEWQLFHNFLIPSFKLVDKQRRHSKIIKRFDSPKTPYQRILEANDSFVSHKTKERLRMIKRSLNPFELRKKMESKIAKVLRSTRTTSNINSEATKLPPDPHG